MYIVKNKYVMFVYTIYRVENFDKESLTCTYLKLLDYQPYFIFHIFEELNDICIMLSSFRVLSSKYNIMITIIRII